MRSTAFVKLLITILVSLSLSGYSQDTAIRKNKSLPAADSLIKNNVIHQ